MHRVELKADKASSLLCNFSQAFLMHRVELKGDVYIALNDNRFRLFLMHRVELKEPFFYHPFQIPAGS